MGEAVDTTEALGTPEHRTDEDHEEAPPSSAGVTELASAADLDGILFDDPAAANEATTSAAPAAPAVPPPLPTQPAKAKPPLSRFMVAVVAVNVLLAVGLVGLRREERQRTQPIAAIAADVKSLHAGEADGRAELAATKAKLDEAHHRLDKQEKLLSSTAEKVEETAQRQRAAEREAKERDARQDRELQALSTRVAKVDRETVSLRDALGLIDAVQGAPKTKAKPEAAPHEP